MGGGNGEANQATMEKVAEKVVSQKLRSLMKNTFSDAGPVD